MSVSVHERDVLASSRGSMGNRKYLTDNWEHLPFDLIKDFAYGTTSLDEVQLHHFYNCEECSQIGAAFKREAEVIKRARVVGAKAEEEMARLLKEHPTKSDEKSD